MPKSYSYVVARDYGFAPNPFNGILTLAACKPVIGSIRGGIPELISSDRGVLYEAEDYHALAEKMITMKNF